MSKQYLTVDHLSTKDLIRIFSKIQVSTKHFYNSSPCWDWTAYKAKGYGKTNIGSEYVATHRLMFAWLIKPIPKGHGNGIPVLDHLCCRPCCCNPLHLELVSDRVNLMRGTSPSALCAQKTECKNGHPLQGDNLYIKPSGERCCRTCRRSESKQISQRRKSDSKFQEHCRKRDREWMQRKRAKSHSSQE